MVAAHAGRVARSKPCKRTPKPHPNAPSRSHKARATSKLAMTQVPRKRDKERGNAIVEVIAALLALTPFLIGIPLLGKQFDVKHKTLDAARYAVWERTVWRTDGVDNRKNEWDVALEIRDRTFGSPIAGLMPADNLHSSGVSDNPLWRDTRGEPLLAYRDGQVAIAIEQKRLVTPVDVGHLLVPGIAHGSPASKTIAIALGVDDLRLARDTFLHARVVAGLRNVFRITRDEAQRPLVHEAAAAILSDTWSARDENTMRRRVDDLTTNELIESLEFPGRPIARQALGKGQPMYGEGQFATDVDLRPSSTVLPAAYVSRKR